ncbi:iron permease [Abortiporus biennis]|nr:iron permease [Abortiporus biennis]
MSANDHTPPSSTHSNSEPLSKKGKGSAFWLSFVAVLVCIFLSALDLTGISTALPTITADLNGGDNYVWIGSAYALASTAILPLSGLLADVFGRKPIMLASVFLFALGSALAGAAQSMNMLIAARVVEGLGGGAIVNLAEIITSDLVPLAERPLYQGIVSMVWSLASAIGPPIGGAFAEKASWRWLFYINLPLTGIASVLVFFWLKVKTPPGSIMSKLRRIDWIGNMIVISGTTLAIVGLTFAGIRYPWSSVQVLAPLIIGMLLVCAFILYEAKVPEQPTIPWEVISNSTSFSGFLSVLIHGIASISIIYYLPVFFQACHGSSPIRSGVEIFPTALVISPFAFIAVMLVQVTNKYRSSNVIGWILTTVGFGLLSLLRADSSTSQWIGYQILAAAGIGMLFPVPVFPILAPLHPSRSASALAFLAFLRSFAQTWGITISSTILQNELNKKLPAQFVQQFPGGVEIAFAAIPVIRDLPEPLRTEVREAFAISMSTIWKTMVGISGIGIISLLFMKEIPMITYTDQTYGLEEVPGKVDEEKRVVDVTVHVHCKPRSS